MGRRFGEIILGLVLLMVGLASLEGAPPVLLFLAVFGFFLLARQFNMTNRSAMLREDRDFSEGRIARRRTRRLERDDDLAPPTPVSMPREGHIYDHALDAARAAGMDVQNARVYPVDIGVMAFRDEDDPIIYRTSEIPDDMDYIQPYVQLRLPMRVRGTIRFEIRDGNGERVFLHQIERDLARGDNLITPAARLPVHDALGFDGRWELLITANDVPVAHHTLTWRETGSRLMRQHIQEDGEMSSELKALVEDSRLGRLSLDELLADQEEGEPVEVEPPRQRGSRGAN